MRANFYDVYGVSLSYVNAASGGPGTLNDVTWQQKGNTVTAPANAVSMKVQLYNYMSTGWTAWDDVTVNGPGVISVKKYYYAGGTRVAYVFTNDEIYKFVDKGTAPHIIMAKHRMRPLVFQTGYKAKTAPGTIGSRAGGPFGPTVRALVVHHPGTEARRFTETIQKKWEKDITRAMADVVKNAVISS